MHNDESSSGRLISRNPEAREIHELAYLKHRTGASDVEIWRAIDKVGNDRAKVERALSAGDRGQRILGLIRAALPRA